MFPIECREVLPVNNIVITSVSVRGRLGPLTVWVSKEDRWEETELCASTWETKSEGQQKRRSQRQHCQQHRRLTRQQSKQQRSSEEKGIIRCDPRQWTKIYEKLHPPSFRSFVDLDLSSDPIVMHPGQVRGIYIHSTLPGDQAIVYDNHYGLMNRSDTPQDDFVRIRTALAHVSETPFGSTPIWGWGDAWRKDRKFVGRVNYGLVYKLWHPRNHLLYGNRFRHLVTTLFLCQRRFESPLSRLPDDCIFYILHLCKWDWSGDTSQLMDKEMKSRRENTRALANTSLSTLSHNEPPPQDHSPDTHRKPPAQISQDTQLKQDAEHHDELEWNEEWEDEDEEDDREDQDQDILVDSTWDQTSHSTVLYDPNTHRDDDHDEPRRRPIWLRPFVTQHGSYLLHDDQPRGMHLVQLLRGRGHR